MPNLYSTLSVTEPGYGERVVRVRGAIHRHGVSETSAVDLVTGERLLMPISTRWDFETKSNVRVCAEGWSWRTISLAEAERRTGLPKGSLPPHSDTVRTDLWAEQRMRSPAFIALLTILTDHPEVVFYDVDWRYWVHLDRPRILPHLGSSELLREPNQSSWGESGRHVPYPLGGSGDMERFASYLSTFLSAASSCTVEQAPQTFETLSEALLADLRDDYQQVVEWQQRPQASSRLHRAPADMPVVRSFGEIQALTRWTPDLLAQLDDLHTDTCARLGEETAAYRPRGVALSLF